MQIKPHFMAAKTPDAQEAKAVLESKYGRYSLARANVAVALGGDGFMLDALKKVMGRGMPLYGLNFGTLGFLMNQVNAPAKRIDYYLAEKLSGALLENLTPLLMRGTQVSGNAFQAYAFNDVVAQRQRFQQCQIEFSIRDQISDERLVGGLVIGDGLLVSTPAGSTGYYAKAGGGGLYLNMDSLGVLSICADTYLTDNDQGANERLERSFNQIIPNHMQVSLSIQDSQKRPVCLVADNRAVRNVKTCDVSLDPDKTVPTLFDEHFDHRIFNRQRIIRHQGAALVQERQRRLQNIRAY